MRAAVTKAEALSGEVVINLKNLSYALNMGELPALNDGGLNLTIQDNQGGLATINPNKTSRIFEVDSGTLTINHLRLINGLEASGSDSYGGAIVLEFGNPVLNVENSQLSGNEALGASGGQFGSAGFGGAIANLGGSVNISGSTLANNLARGGDAAYGGVVFGGEAGGGAVYIGGEGGPVTIRASTLSGNKAIGGNAALTSGAGQSIATAGEAQGGGLYSSFGEGLHVLNSTFAYNLAQGGKASQQGGNGGNAGIGGSAFGGALNVPNGFNSALTNDTIAFNTARSEPGFGTGQDGAAQAGGVSTGGEGIQVLNTIIAKNTVLGPQATDPDVSGGFADQGHNLIGDTGDSSGFSASNNDLFGNPGLSRALNSNGAPANAPLTLALLPTSRAVDAGDNSVLTNASPTGDIVTTDERGVKRPQGPAVDIGAFELVKASKHGRDILP